MRMGKSVFLGGYKIVVLLAVVFTAAVFVVLNGGAAFADDEEVIEIEGNTPIGELTTCANFVDGYQSLCTRGLNGLAPTGPPGNGSGGGGASWHIYETTGKNAYSGPVIEGSGWGIVSGDTTLEDIKEECTPDVSNWYVAFGWEGTSRTPPGRYGILTGPTNRMPGSLLAVDANGNEVGWEYNDYGALKYETVQERIDKGGDLNNKRITKDAALQLYKKYKNGKVNKIPDQTGSFCVDGGAATFKGRARAWSGSWSDSDNKNRKTTKYVAKDKTAVLVLNDCDDGCKGKLAMDLQLASGSGETSYTIKRTTNTNYNLSGSYPKESNLDNDSDGHARVNLDEFDLSPGQYVCDSMTFGKSTKNDKKATVTACIYAEGSIKSSIDIKANNTRLNSGWKDDSVYAKPEDAISLKTDYNPKAQSAFNLTAIKTKITNGSTEASADNDNRTIGTVFGNIKFNNTYLTWKNAFRVHVDSKTGWEKPGTIGSTSSISDLGSYTVSYNDVGVELGAEAITNTTANTSTTPKSVKFSYNSGEKGNIAAVDINKLSDKVKIVVPYSFTNKAETTMDNGTVFYAGETQNVIIKLITSPRYNEYTKAEYATKVPVAKYKLEVKYSDGTSSTFEKNIEGGLNKDGKTEGDVLTPDKASIDVSDVPAGTQICVKAAVYPELGNDLNKEGNKKWSPWSNEECFKVAKKPSFQVWGGNVYSGAGGIATLPSEKTTIKGFGSVKYRAFGSWAELGVISTGEVSGLASGAGTGILGDGLDGSPDSSYCKRVTLSFANNNCGSGKTGSIGIDTSQRTTERDKASILERYISSVRSGKIDGNEVDPTIIDESRKTNVGAYEYNGGDKQLSIINDGNATLKAGTTTVVYTTGNVIIKSDIKRDDNETYDSLEKVPRLIIYGGNIEIQCNVNRIDALLVAESKVNTCLDGTDDVNARQRSNSLIINGAIIAEGVELDRTYGAGPGAASGVPAEIINFDSTLYVWGAMNSGVTKSGKVTTTSLKELSPRY